MNIMSGCDVDPCIMSGTDVEFMHRIDTPKSTEVKVVNKSDENVCKIDTPKSHDVKVFNSSDENVCKYVFFPTGAVIESVLYKYPTYNERTVICVSVQSGCPVGCTFCGTGGAFIRNLTPAEIVAQITYIINDKNIQPSHVGKFQIMFMSMGEPFLNYENVKEAILILHSKFPNAELLVSTIAPNAMVITDFIKLSTRIKKIGLQFSIHKSTDDQRDQLIPFSRKLSLAEIRDYGVEWWNATGRKPYCNYCIGAGDGSYQDFINLRNIFPPNVFAFTFSVVCESDESIKSSRDSNMDTIKNFTRLFNEECYDTRIFDPAGQDDIGGGCGQLWYVQKHLRKGNTH